MTRERKSVFLTILTLVVYAGIQWLENGLFLFPFPLFEPLFLIICIQFSFWNWKEDRLQTIALLVFSIFNLLSTQFFWSLVYDPESMEKLTNGFALDIYKILRFLFLLIWVTVYLLRTQQAYKLPFYIFNIALIISTLITNIQIFEILAFGSIAFWSFHYKQHIRIYPLWILLTALAVMRVITATI
jgi:hypothetical protein